MRKAVLHYRLSVNLWKVKDQKERRHLFMSATSFWNPYLL
jgi:hypothetical protein